MAVKDVAVGLTELCKKGAFDEAIASYYGPNIVSVEPFGDPREVVGLEAVLGKVEWWNNNFEVHGVEVDGPFINGDEFAVRFKLDATNKGNGERSIMDEIAVYKVHDDKIVHERFFFS